VKGIIFTELVEMVETTFSPEIADRIIEKSDLPSGGVYTAVGTYDHSEIVSLVTALSEETGMPAKDLVLAYCNHLFGRFTELYPQFFSDKQDVFSFLKGVDGVIHVEVKKLYPDAELPRFTCEELSDNELRMTYHSSRHLGDVAEGLILGCIGHFKEDITIARKDLTNGGDAVVQFDLSKAA